MTDHPNTKATPSEVEAVAKADIKDLVEAVLAYKAERDLDDWGDDEVLLRRQMHVRQRMFDIARQALQEQSSE